MSNSLQEFLANGAKKAAGDLVTALFRLPEDKRGWTPGEKSRSAIDQVAECALNNGYTADFIVNRKWAAPPFEEYLQRKAEIAAGDWESLNGLLQSNLEKVVDVIRTLPDEDLDIQLEMPWGNGSVREIIAYPYWNMTYHEGQINYIASILGVL